MPAKIGWVARECEIMAIDFRCVLQVLMVGPSRGHRDAEDLDRFVDFGRVVAVTDLKVESAEEEIEWPGTWTPSASAAGRMTALEAVFDALFG